MVKVKHILNTKEIKLRGTHNFENICAALAATRELVDEKTAVEAIKEFGFCSGIENYARHFEHRKPGETPYTILDFYGDDWLLVIDESHISLPQFRGMYETDKSRKTTLVEYGFRLPSALDNRPLKFDEMQSKMDKVIYVSATPNE